MLRNWGGGGRFLEDTKEGERPKETTEGRAKGAKKKMNKKRRKGLHCGGRLHKRHASIWQETWLR